MDRDNGLYLMFAKQRELQENGFKFTFDEMSNDEKLEYIRFNVLGLTDELHEMLQETGWKPWASSNHINRHRAFDELTDAWHFLMNLMMIVSPDGYTSSDVADELVSRYCQKHQINHNRMSSGYDGVSSKCPDCKAALDDNGAFRTVNEKSYCSLCDKDITYLVR